MRGTQNNFNAIIVSFCMDNYLRGSHEKVKSQTHGLASYRSRTPRSKRLTANYGIAVNQVLFPLGNDRTNIEHFSFPGKRVWL